MEHEVHTIYMTPNLVDHTKYEEDHVSENEFVSIMGQFDWAGSNIARHVTERLESALTDAKVRVSTAEAAQEAAEKKTKELQGLVTALELRLEHQSQEMQILTRTRNSTALEFEAIAEADAKRQLQVIAACVHHIGAVANGNDLTSPLSVGIQHNRAHENSDEIDLDSLQNGVKVGVHNTKVAPCLVQYILPYLAPKDGVDTNDPSGEIIKQL